MATTFWGTWDQGTWLACDLVIKATLLLLLAIALHLSLRRGSAAWRHRVWCVAFAALLLLPVLRIALPSLSWPVIPEAWRAEGAETSSLPEQPSATLALYEMEPRENTDAPAPATELAGSPEQESVAQPSVATPFPLPPSPAPVDAPQPLSPIMAPDTTSAPAPLFIVWMIGVLVTALPLISGLVGNVRLKRRSAAIDSAVTRQRVAELARRAGLPEAPTILLAGDSQMPMTFGWRRPYVVLPKTALGWSPERLDAVLLHEFSHIRRRDVPLQLMARLACCVYWFHPLAWWSLARMRLDRELACDDSVLAAGHDSSGYAAQLLDIAREHVSLPAWSHAALSMARQSQLEGRLLSVLDANRSRTPVAGLRSLCFSLLSLVTVAGLASLRPGYADSAAGSHPGAVATAENTDQQTCVLTGRVTLADGQPARDVAIELLIHQHPGSWHRLLPDEEEIERHSTRSDSQGRFQLEVPRDPANPPHAAKLIAAAPGTFPVVESITALLPRVEVELRFEETKTFVLQLIDPVGNPVAGVTPRIDYVALPGKFIGVPHPGGQEVVAAWPVFTTSDSEGNTRAELPAAAYEVNLRIADERVGTDSLRLKLKDSPRGVVLQPPTSIEGTVTDPEGKPVEGADVMVMEEPYHVVRTDSSGRFRTSSVSGHSLDGDCDIYIYPPADSDLLFHAALWKRPVEGATRAEVNVELTRGIVIEGQVVDAESGAPVPAARLEFEAQYKNNPEFNYSLDCQYVGAEMHYVTDNEGRFRLPVSPGPGYLKVNARSLDYLPVELTYGEQYYGKPGLQREYYDGVARLNVKRGETPEPLKIELSRGELLRCRVVRPDGTPASGKAYALSYRRDKKDVSNWLPELTIAEGQLELPGFDPQKSLPLYLYDPEGPYGAAITAEDLPQLLTEGTIHLKPGGAARFRFVNQRGEPLQNYHPRVLLVFKEGASATHIIRPDQPVWSDTIIWDNVTRQFERPRTNEQGEATINGLIAGAEYRISSFNQEGYFESHPFEVRSGETTDVGEVSIFEEE